jgi:hypothetical protein
MTTTPEVKPLLITCTACDQVGNPSVARPGLCPECASAADTVDVMNSHGMDMNDAHCDLMVAALEELRKDPAAFRVIRRFTALLNTDAAILLFLDRNHCVCLEP